jgi:hypothetical protein
MKSCCLVPIAYSWDYFFNRVFGIADQQNALFSIPHYAVKWLLNTEECKFEDDLLQQVKFIVDGIVGQIRQSE